MNKKNLAAVPAYSLYFVFAVIGVMSSTAYFGSAYSNETINGFGLLLMTVLGVTAALVIYFIDRYRTAMALGFYIIIIIIILFNLLKFYGGIAYIINNVIEDIYNYYGIPGMYIDFSREMFIKADVNFAIKLLCLVCGFSYMNVILYKRAIILPVIINLAAYFLPATLESRPPVYILVETAMFLCFLCVYKGINGVKDRKKEIALAAEVSGAMALMCLVVMLLTMVIKPEKGYEISKEQLSLRGKLIFTVNDIREYFMERKDVLFNIANKKLNEISAGDLKNSGSFKFSNKQVFAVRVPENAGRIYFKAYDAGTYTGNRWNDISNSIYSRNSEKFKKWNQAGFYPQNSASQTLSVWASQGNDNVNLSVYEILFMQMKGDEYSYIAPSAIKVDGQDYSNAGKNALEIKYDKNPEYTESQKGRSNVLHSFYLADWQNRMSIKSMYMLGQEIDNYYKALAVSDYFEAEREYRQFVYDNYLDVTTPCADRIKNELIDEIKSGDYSLETAQGKAKFINDLQIYFQKNYIYTTTPGITPQDEDFVDYFLFTSHKGFCIYFATSGVMILRSAGIPARYAEGYILPEILYNSAVTLDMTEKVEKYENSVYDSSYSPYVEISITDKYAHAWVEVYVDGIGWITVDPTPGYLTLQTREELQDEENSEEETTETEDMTEEVTEEATEETTVSETDDTENDENVSGNENNPNMSGVHDTDSNEGFGTGENGNNGAGTTTESIFSAIGKIAKRILKLVWIVFKVVIIPLIIVLTILLRKKYVEQNRNKLYNESCGLDRLERIRKILHYFERYMKFCGYSFSMTEGYAEFFRRCKMFSDSEKAAGIAMLIEKTLYSGKEPSEEETKNIIDFVNRTRNILYEREDWYRKLWMKYILVL